MSDTQFQPHMIERRGYFSLKDGLTKVYGGKYIDVDFEFWGWELP